LTTAACGCDGTDIFFSDIAASDEQTAYKRGRGTQIGNVPIVVKYNTYVSIRKRVKRVLLYCKTELCLVSLLHDALPKQVVSRRSREATKRLTTCYCKAESHVTNGTRTPPFSQKDENRI